MHKWTASLSFFVVGLQCTVLATIDVNLSELEYLAARLNPFECRRLIAALHYTTYDLPKSIAAAERRVDEEIPCFKQLLHWNSSPTEGKGKTHEAIVHRLRQINRNDLANWLGKATFRQLGKDLDRAMARPFDDLGVEETEAPYPLTLEPIDSSKEDDSWAQIDVVLIAILLGLFGTLLTFICTTIIYRIKLHFRKSKLQEENEDIDVIEKMNERRRRKAKYSGKETSGAVTDKAQTETETDTDFG